MDNFLNSVENTLVTFFSSGGAGDLTSVASLVHAKVLEDPRSYHNREIPAVGIYASGYIGDADDRHNDGVTVYIEVTSFGAKLSDVDDEVKQLAAMIINNLRAQAPQIGGHGISFNFDDVYVDSAQVYPMNRNNNGLMIQASINAEVYFKT